MNDYDKGLKNCTGKLGKEESMLMMLQASIQSALHSGRRVYENSESSETFYHPQKFRRRFFMRTRKCKLGKEES